MPTMPSDTGRSASSARVGAWFSTTPITRARTRASALEWMSKRSGVSAPDFTLTVSRAVSGQRNTAGATVSAPSSATTRPRAMTVSIGSAVRSEVRIASARRPGAMEPSSRSSPKWVAVLIVAICSATSGSSPQSMAWRTTRSMWPSSTSVPA